MALYCAGFAGYIRALLPWEMPAWSYKAIGIGLIVAVVLINMVGSKLVGRSELFVVTIELAILAVFAVFGLMKADPGRLADNGDHHWLGALFAAGLLYVTYEGFGVVTNSAGDMRDPAKELPRAMFLALGIVVVVYVLVSTIVVMTLSLQSMDANQGHVLSEAGAAAMGRVGFVVIGVAALLATASGVNATMFGDANLAYMRRCRDTPANGRRSPGRCGSCSRAAGRTARRSAPRRAPAARVWRSPNPANCQAISLAECGGAAPLDCSLRRAWITLLAVLVLSFVFEIVYRKRTGRTLKTEPQRSP
jgi:hypothetical protein